MKQRQPANNHSLIQKNNYLRNYAFVNKIEDLIEKAKGESDDERYGSIS